MVKVTRGPSSIPTEILDSVRNARDQAVDFLSEDLQSLAEGKEPAQPSDRPQDGQPSDKPSLFVIEGGEPASNSKLLNLAKLSEATDGDQVVAKAKLKNFLISSRLEVMTMRDAHRAERTDRLFVEAQTLHRNATQLGAELFADALDRLLEAISRDHREAIAPLLQRVDEAHGRLITAIETRLRLAA